MILHEIKSSSSVNIFGDLMDRIEKEIIREALRRTENNRTRAAELLGFSRPTLHSKIEKHGLWTDLQKINWPPQYDSPYLRGRQTHWGQMA